MQLYNDEVLLSLQQEIVDDEMIRDDDVRMQVKILLVIIISLLLVWGQQP